MPKLPENIDQLDRFYQEQFEDFAPEVSDAVWESVNKNIGQSTGFSVSTSYLLKVAGVLLGSLAVVSVALKNTENTQEKTIEEVKNVVTEELPTIETEQIKTISEETELEKENNPPVVQDQEATAITSNEDPTALNSTSEIVEDTTQQMDDENSATTDFQFVEELELE